MTKEWTQANIPGNGTEDNAEKQKESKNKHLGSFKKAEDESE